MLVIVLKNLMRFFTKKSFYLQGFFAVKRRAVFILGAKWKTLVWGWRRDCVVGGMGTRFQWRKAHNPSAKCEAFHVAPRLFFMFLFFIPFTIRQQCIIYPQKFSTESGFFAALRGLTQIPLIWRNCFDGGKSHGGFFAALWGLTQIQQQKIFVKICVVSGCLN